MTSSRKTGPLKTGAIENRKPGYFTNPDRRDEWPARNLQLITFAVF